MGQPSFAPEMRQTPIYNEKIDNSYTTYLNNVQASDMEAIEIELMTHSVNTDESNSHIPTRHPMSEAVQNPPESPATDLEPTMSRADPTDNEPGSEMAAELLHTQSDCQNKWIHRFSSIADSVKLEETLTNFMKEAKTVPQGAEATKTQTRSEPQTRRLRQFPHRQRNHAASIIPRYKPP
jgi:hypothetical protein